MRLSPERFGIELAEALQTSQDLIDGGLVDFLDISLWDSFKLPEDEAFQSQSLLAHFADLDRKGVMLTVAGKITTASDVAAVLAANIDFVTIGRAAILHHDYPVKVAADENFVPATLPVSRAYLANEGLSETFINYMSSWKGFVES